MGSIETGYIDVAIVAWRTRALLRACLQSVLGQPEVDRIVVVDNASGDGTVEMVQGEFPEVHLIANQCNLGYAAANNQAIRAGRAPFILLLNPDTVVQDGAFEALLQAFEENLRVGAVGAQLVLPDGSIQRSCRSFPEPRALLTDALGLWRLFPQSAFWGRYRMTYWDHDSPQEVDQPMASALAIRRSALEEVGLFDEGFPLYFNDVDLCYRLKQAEWRIVFQPKAKVTHHHGQSTGQIRAAALIESHRSLIHFYAKHYRGKIGWLGYWSVVLAAWITMYPRAALASASRRYST